MIDWQPIETAPKDGRPVLIFNPEDEAAHTCYWETDGFFGPGWAAYGAPGSLYKVQQPTHWAKLNWPEEP
jgi:hypothetical protein